MTEVVSSVRRVTDIVGEISAASQEQSAGIGEIGRAITMMDQATQQNAALVEQAAAAAQSLQEQAANLAKAVAGFKLHDYAQAAPARPPEVKRAVDITPSVAALKNKPAAASTKTAPAKPKPAPENRTVSSPKASRKEAVSDDNSSWEEF